MENKIRLNELLIVANVLTGFILIATAILLFTGVTLVGDETELQLSRLRFNRMFSACIGCLNITIAAILVVQRRSLKKRLADFAVTTVAPQLLAWSGAIDQMLASGTCDRGVLAAIRDHFAGLASQMKGEYECPTK